MSTDFRARLAALVSKRKDLNSLEQGIGAHCLRSKLQHLACLYLLDPTGWTEDYAKEFVSVARWMVGATQEVAETTNPGPVICVRCFANRGTCLDRGMFVSSCILCKGIRVSWYELTRLDWLAAIVTQETGLNHWFVEDAFVRAARSYGQRNAERLARALKLGECEWCNA